MKIAITAAAEGLDAPVDPRFGRAQCFILYETEDGTYTVQGNRQNLQARQGAGIQAGRTIAESGAVALITGNCGPKAFSLLATAGVKVYVGAGGTVRDSIDAFEKGSLDEAKEANVKGHWV